MYNIKRDQNGNTPAMVEALQGKIPSGNNWHTPELQNNNGWTVAMILAYKGIIPPTEWFYRKEI